MTEARSTLTVEVVGDETSGTAVLAVAGELDLATISRLKDAVSGHLRSGRRVILDLSAMTFCDSTGLGAFVGLHRQAVASGADICLAAPQRRIDDLLRLSGISQVIRIFPTRAEATAA